MTKSKSSKQPQAAGGVCLHPAEAPPCCGGPNTSCYTRSEKRVGTGGGSHAFSVAGTFRFYCAGVAELVDARDLKSLGLQGPCRFDSGPPHQIPLRSGDTRNLCKNHLESFGAHSGTRWALPGMPREITALAVLCARQRDHSGLKSTCSDRNPPHTQPTSAVRVRSQGCECG